MAVYRAIERPDLAAIPEYVDPCHASSGPRNRQAGREWVGTHTFDTVMKVFLAAGVAAAPVYDARQLLADEHFRARGTFVVVDDQELGRVTVQSPVAVLSETPGAVQHLGRELGADNDSVYGGLLGLDAARIAALRAAGTI